MSPTSRLVALFALFVLGITQINAIGFYDHKRYAVLPSLLIDPTSTTDRAEIPLKSVHVDVEMIDSLAKVTIVQTYLNPLAVPVHVSYVFPLDDRAAVSGFLAEFPNGRKLVGVSKEKGEARKEYEDAVSAGHQAVLLDQFGSDVFKAAIGNLDAKQEVKITITYLTKVVQESSREYRFTLPTVLSPRYKPSSDPKPQHYQQDVPYDIAIDMSISMFSEIAQITSPTHEISNLIKHSATKNSISLGGELDSDFVVVVKLKDPAMHSSLIVETDPTQHDNSAVYLNLKSSDFELPPARFENGGLLELYFVVDVSGSMHGEKMEDTKRAMRAAMTLMREEQRKIPFNIIAFSTHYTPLFQHYEILDDATYAKAMQFIDSMYANGGTELLEPLQFISSLPLPKCGQLRRRVIVLTDGQVGNDQDIFKLVKEMSATTEVFSVGIGNGVSHSLVNGLATHGNGVAEYVVLGEQVQEKMSRQLTRALSLTSANIKITFDNPVSTGITQSPAILPPIYSETDLPIMFLIPRGIQSIIVEVLETGQKLTFPLMDGKQVRSDIIHKMAAKAKIRDFELILEGGEIQANEEEIRQIRTSIINLATQYNLMSTQTSFVAVDPDSHVEVPAVSMDVPVQYERGRAVHRSSIRTMAGMPSGINVKSAVMPDMTVQIEMDAFGQHDVAGANDAPSDLDTQTTQETTDRKSVV